MSTPSSSSPDEVSELCPQIDLTGGGKHPILGAAYHPPGSIIRHDAVVWGYAAAAQRLGVHVHQGVEVTGIARRDGRCSRRRDDRRARSRAGTVVCAVAGTSRNVAAMAGVRLPIATTRCRRS